MTHIKDGYIDWIDKAYAEIEEAYDNGELTTEEYKAAVRELRDEIKQNNQEDY